MSLYRSIFELSMVGAAHLDLQARVIWANASFAGFLGYSPATEIFGKRIPELTHPDDLAASLKRIGEVVRGEVDITTADRRYRHKDGHYVWVNISAKLMRTPSGEPSHIVGLMLDISERKKQELLLRESEERLASILETVQDVVWSFSATQYRLIYMNKGATQKLYHRESAEFLQNPELWMEVVHPEDRSHVGGIWSRLADQGFAEDHYRVRRPDGEVRWVHARAWRTMGADGKPSRFEGIVRDVTEIKNAQLALQVSESRLQLVMTSGRIGIWELKPSTGEMIWSPVFKEICGFPPEFPASLDAFSALYHPADREKCAAEYREMVERGKRDFEPFRIVRHDGQVRWLQSVGHVVSEGVGANTRLIGALIDVTSSKEAEQIIEAQKAKMTAASKMSALGEMAGGLAHEINNPVAIIHGNAALLKQLAATGAIDREVMEKTAGVIESTASRISKITRALRAFARDAEQDPFEKVTVKSVVDETAEFCRERFRGHGIQFIIDPIDPAIELECRPVQISQVLLNLLNNAHDVVENVPDSWIRVSATATPEMVELSVADSGAGIAPDLREKIFQPFFTAKEVGRGTGLGLSVAKGIVESHAGFLTVDANAKNTRFVVRLPRMQH
ncbi:MAG: PAS domain-containing sensor histidine kinase [Bdellovibrionota bacterium]